MVVQNQDVYGLNPSPQDGGTTITLVYRTKRQEADTFEAMKNHGQN
jgi:hypothetical protein